MRKPVIQFIFFVALLSSFIAAQTPLHMPAKPNPNLYPANANVRQEIADTVAKAEKSNKRILLVFGANWCGDCYALDYAFHQASIEPTLDANYKVIHIDVGKFDKNLDVAAKYQINLHKGIPSIALLDSKGSLLNATAEFERARVMTEEDVLAFLNKWKPPAAK